MAALVLVLKDDGPKHQRQAAADVLGALGIDLTDLDGMDRRGVAAQTASPLLQAAALIRGEASSWATQSDEALFAQGRASAQGAAMFVKFGLPMLPGLAEALDLPGAKMLDVGTGVAAMAIAYAELFPALTVVGLDVLPRVLEHAAATLAASEVRDRVLLREQDVSSLDEVATCARVAARSVPARTSTAGRRNTRRRRVSARRLGDGRARQVQRRTRRRRHHPLQDTRLRRHPTRRPTGTDPAPRRRAHRCNHYANTARSASHHRRPQPHGLSPDPSTRPIVFG